MVRVADGDPPASSSDGSAPRNAFVVVEAFTAGHTRAIAFRLARTLLRGDVLCLYGDLGAGKTTFVQGLAAGLGFPGPVTSPTFTLIHEYRGGRLPLLHFDMYRLSGPADLPDLGFDEYLAAAEGVVVIEWPERVTPALPPGRLDITLEEIRGNPDNTSATDVPEEGRRRITIFPRSGSGGGAAGGGLG